MIAITRLGDAEPLRFAVVVREGAGESRHRVTLSRETFTRLAGEAHTPEQCIEAAFRFLLEREPQESILSQFDLIVIARYFPEFERELPRYFSAS